MFKTFEHLAEAQKLSGKIIVILLKFVGRRGLMDRASASYLHGAKGLGFNPPWRQKLYMLPYASFG